MAQAPQFSAEQLAHAAKALQQLENAPKAGAIKGSKTINELIETFEILNVEEEVSTLKAEQFPKITVYNQGNFIISDVDEELLFKVAFREEVDLESITFYAIQTPKEDEMSAPLDIVLLKLDSLNHGFDDVKDKKGDAIFKCKKDKLTKGQTFKLKSKVKFRKVTKLLIYIKSNLEGTEQTYLNGIQFKGTSKQKTDMSKWEEVAAEAKKKLHE